MKRPYRPRNAFEVRSFDRASFENLVGRLSSMCSDYEESPQAKYLASYLERHGAKTLVIEHHYRDRHFLDETRAYYSKCLIRRPNACARVHAFRSEFSKVTLRAHLSAATVDERKKVEARLENDYLGFIVVRPVLDVPIGRTVLLPPPGTDDLIKCTAEYDAHFGGLTLELKALGFMQQDRGVGACATAAVWSALQCWCRNDRRIAPTPAAITESAQRRDTFLGRQYPTSGLTGEEICEALRAAEFPPEVLYYPGPSTHPAACLKARIGIYLRSGIPVILSLRQSDGHPRHAVTAAGTNRLKMKAPTIGIALDGDLVSGEVNPGDSGEDGQEREIVQLRLTTLKFDQFYLHDDRIGPYVSAEVQEAVHTDLKTGRTTTILALSVPDPKTGKAESWTVQMAYAPLHPILRSTSLELLFSSCLIAELVEKVSPNHEVELEPFFQGSGNYLGQLSAMNTDLRTISRFKARVALSRWVGVTRWSLAEKPLFDALWDTTDRFRHQTAVEESLLGIVVFDPRVRNNLKALASELQVPIG